MQINWNEASTKRNAVRLVMGISAMIFVWMGKDPTQVLAIGSALAGGMGMVMPDDPKK